MELTTLIKDCTTSVCKSADFIDILIIGDTLIVDVSDTALGIINLGLDTQSTYCFRYKDSDLEELLNRHEVDTYKMNKILGYWKDYESLAATTMEIARCDDLRQIEEFENLLALKADQGLGFYKMPCNELYKYCLVPVFSGFPNVNKADKIGIVVRRLDWNTLLMEYHIYKKKLNKDVTIWFRTLDMCKTYQQHEHHEF